MKITDILSDLGIEFAREGQHHHIRSGWIGLHCPFCSAPRGEKGRYKLGIETASGRCNCWSCGKHSVASVLVELGRVSYRVANELLKGANLKRLDTTKTSKRVAGILTNPKNRSEVLAEPHRQYLLGRGFDPEDVQKLWKIQSISIAPRLQWRLFIPIDFNGEEVSWTTRTISNSASPRYVSARPEEEKRHLKDVLYGIDLVRTTLIIVEGPTDAWNVGPGAAAVFGLNYTPAQVDLMSRFPSRVTCFDNAPDAQRRAIELCETLSLSHGKTTNICLDAEDPGSASAKEIRLFRKCVLGG